MKSVIKLTIEAGKAKPNSIINSSIGPKGINILEFCKKFNLLTKKYKKGEMIPILLKIKEKKFKILLKNPTVSFYLKKFLKIKKDTKKEKIFVNFNIIKKIYKIKKKDFNTRNKNKIFKTIIGTIKTFGLKYEKKNK
ncbi:50S ribosomal protein L11 [Candidatus Vidania fulgoroideorum]